MTVKIRQEINIINRQVVVVNYEYELVRCLSSNYNNATFYFEILATNVDDTAHIVALANAISNTEISISIPANTNTITMFRSATLSPVDGTNNGEKGLYCLFSDVTIYSAKIIILQSAEDITDTQTQIEVGQYLLTQPAVINTWYPIPDPKYWKYESSKWDPTPTFKLGFTFGCEDDMESYKIALEYDDGSFNWSGNYVGLVEGINTEEATYYESSNFTPTDGLHYRLVYQGDDYRDDIFIYNAKVICTQTDATAITKLQPEYLLINEAQDDTGLQEFLIDWDPDEWEGVDNDYYHEHSADSASSNTKLQSDPGGTPADIPDSDITGDDLVSSKSLTFIDTDYQSGNYQSAWSDGTYIYVACGSAGLRVYSFNGTTLTHIDTDFQDGYYTGVWGDGTYIYVACGSTGLRAYSFDGNDLTPITVHDNGGVYRGVCGDGTYIYAACGISGLSVYSFNGTTLTHIDNDYQGSSEAYAVWSDGSYIYVAHAAAGLMVYSFNGTTLTHIDTDFQDGYYTGVWGDGTYIYVACGSTGLKAYSFDGNDLTHIEDAANLSGTYDGVWSDGTYIYVACRSAGLRVYSFNGTTLTHIDIDYQSGNYFGVCGDGTYIYVSCDNSGLKAYKFLIGMTMPATAKEIDTNIVVA